MKHIVFLALPFLLLSAGSAYAEWVTVRHTQAEPTHYVDSDTIRRNGAVVKWWELLDYKTVQSVAGASFLSVKIQREFDCAEEQTRTLAMTEFSGNMGRGTVVYSDVTADKWEPVQPDSIGYTLWKIACMKKESR